MKKFACWSLLVGVSALFFAAGCTVETSAPETSGSGTGVTQSGDTATEVTIRIDGSSTVAPISTAIAEVFDDAHPNVTPKVNVSGTGGGFEKFGKGETDISNASRPIKDKEKAVCEANGITFTEVLVATDGLSVVVNKENTWCKSLTVAQLKEIWKKDSPVHKWSDIDASWPDEPISLFAPDTKSGTYDYFKEETVGKDNPMRSDYQPNTDDNVLVTGIIGDKNSMGFFGFAYYVESKDKMNAVAISPTDDVADAVLPTQQSIESGAYKPLSRPLFIYVNNAALKTPEIAEFAKFHISDEGQKLVELKDYIKLNPEQLAGSRKSLDDAISALAKPAE
ncbi:MAG: PstS family phosphate ABC transporter substrate-binding protein [Planctomycetaceae bacterium]